MNELGSESVGVGERLWGEREGVSTGEEKCVDPAGDVDVVICAPDKKIEDRMVKEKRRVSWFYDDNKALAQLYMLHLQACILASKESSRVESVLFGKPALGE